VRHRETELSAFGELVVTYCKRAGITPYRLGIIAEISSRSRMAYAIRKKGTNRPRSAALPYRDLMRLANALHRLISLEDIEHTRLVVLGLKEQAGPELQAYIAHLERKAGTKADPSAGYRPS
jgi:hypothetical protein